jgi:hypothetical protein
MAASSTSPWFLCLQDPADETNDLGSRTFAWLHIQQTLRECLQAIRWRLGESNKPEWTLSTVGHPALLVDAVGGCHEHYMGVRQDSFDNSHVIMQQTSLGVLMLNSATALSNSVHNKTAMFVNLDYFQSSWLSRKKTWKRDVRAWHKVDDNARTAIRSRTQMAMGHLQLLARLQLLYSEAVVFATESAIKDANTASTSKNWESLLAKATVDAHLQQSTREQYTLPGASFRHTITVMSGELPTDQDVHAEEHKAASSLMNISSVISVHIDASTLINLERAQSERRDDSATIPQRTRFSSKPTFHIQSEPLKADTQDTQPLALPLKSQPNKSQTTGLESAQGIIRRPIGRMQISYDTINPHKSGKRQPHNTKNRASHRKIAEFIAPTRSKSEPQGTHDQHSVDSKKHHNVFKIKKYEISGIKTRDIKSVESGAEDKSK